MPAEHSGAVLENYLWKVLLRRAAGKDGSYMQAPSGVFDHELFSICWGPTLGALSFIFDKSNHQAVYTRTIFGLRYLNLKIDLNKYITQFICTYSINIYQLKLNYLSCFVLGNVHSFVLIMGCVLNLTA